MCSFLLVTMIISLLVSVVAFYNIKLTFHRSCLALSFTFPVVANVCKVRTEYTKEVELFPFWKKAETKRTKLKWTTWVNHTMLLYLPTQIRFLIGGERVTCHWSKLNDALGKHYLELWICTWSGRASWNRGKFECQPRQANNFYAVMAAKRFQTLYFELGGITKHLMTGPSGNSEFCFPSSLNVPLIEVSGKQNSLFPLGPVIKCLMMLYCWI